MLSFFEEGTLVKEVIILRDTGIPLFHYSVTGTKKLDELVAAFLSAMGSIAEQVSEQRITAISFASNKFVWEHKGDLFFVALVSQDDSTEIYRVFLRDLSDQFVSTYYSELKKERSDTRAFKPFVDTVEALLQKFDGIPGLARRYKTGLLPREDLKQLKLAMASVETSRDVLRSSALTHDGFILVSNLRAYELEALLDLLGSLTTATGRSLMTVHTSLDPLTSFFITRTDNDIYSAFVVNAARSNAELMKLTDPFLKTVSALDLKNMKKVLPTRMEETTGFYDYDVVLPLVHDGGALGTSKRLLTGLPAELHGNAVKILGLLDEKITVGELHVKTGLPPEHTDEVLAHLISKGAARIAKLYPIIEERDERFSAFLEVVGMPKKNFAVIDAVWRYCTGAYSIKEISDKTKIQTSRILEVLRSLGEYVRWENERVMSHVR